MDPNETLEKLREHVQAWESDKYTEWTRDQLIDQYAELADHFNALDKWLSSGKDLPNAWEFAPLYD